MQDLQISIAANLLKQGKVIAYPTDTLYGLGADPNNEEAISSIFQIKGRNFTQALPVLLPDIEQIYSWIDINWLDKHNLTQRLLNLVKNFWPGALTVVLKKAKHVSRLLTANQDTIALRVPNHPVALKLLEAFGAGIIGTSANKSGGLEAVDSQQVKAIFCDQLFVLDGGMSRIGKASTIVAFLDDGIKILRQGAIECEKLKDYI